MSRPNPAFLFGFFVALIVAICGVSLAKGGLYLGKHEGDTLHLVQIVLRMAMGQTPHVDFMTPIGALAFAPMSLMVQAGFGIGMAIMLAQALFALLALPGLFWAAYSRLPRFAAYLFGTFVVILITSLVHGEAERSISISMHYNRWAWAISFIVLLLAILPGQGVQRARLDGALIGTGMYFLLMIKVTYFGAFALPILVALLARRAFAELAIAVLAGGVLVALTTLFMGFDFWVAYLGDLLRVAGSDVRPYPSEPLEAVIGAPAYLAGSVLALISVVLLRQSGQNGPGLVLLFLVPAFFYVSFQNHGNDPQWLMFLAILLLASVPDIDIRNDFGWDMRTAIRIAGAMALALIAASFLNMFYSPFRHAASDTETYVAFFPRDAANSDLYTARIRAHRVDQRGPLNISGTPLDAYAEIEEAIEPTVFRGENLPICSLELGMLAWFDAVTRDLENAGYSGPDVSIFAADLFPSYWLFGEFAPLAKGAPWYYGGLPGFENADFLIVPLCPTIYDVRKSILEDIENADISLTELRRTPLYLFYKINQQ